MVLTRSMIKRGVLENEPVWDKPRKRPAAGPAPIGRGINYMSICLTMTTLAIAVGIGLYTRSIYGFVVPAVGLQLYQMAALA
jgi:hypothetical protein